jgi:hypothetical protein
MFDLVPTHQPLRAPLCFENKHTPDGRVYLRAPHTVIQLVEVAAPPPRRISSVVDASAASSSYSSSSSSSSFDEEEMEEEEESVCSSYCSSDDFVPEQQQYPAPTQQTPQQLSAADADAFARRMKRILLWRAHSEAPAPDAASLKRKLAEIDEPLVDDDNVSQSSKRSRSSNGSSRSAQSSAPDAHACPACDAGFASRAALRAHGLRGGSEACCAAVEYALEQ